MVANIEPQIITGQFSSRHNIDLKSSADRLIKTGSYKDLSTVCIIPNLSGVISARVVQNWLTLAVQMNQKFMRIMSIGLDANNAYNSAIEQVLENPILSLYKYILTIEENIVPPFDGLVKLYENIEKYDVVGGLVWDTGITGKPMIYGDPREMPQTFLPQQPLTDCIQECNGLGCGFTLFKMDIFKDPKVPKPWFRAVRQYEPGKSENAGPDLYFFENIKKLGYKVACDTRVKVGNYDPHEDIVW
jgi:hypothetical protein